MTETDDAFWTALIARLTEMRWYGSPALSAGLLPRSPQTGSMAAVPGSWYGDNGRTPPRAMRTSLPRRIRG